MTLPNLPFDPPLVPGTLLKRYKRFLADVRLDDGREVVANCMNTGSMTGLTEAGTRIWLTPHDNPKRKLQWTWQIAADRGVAVGINTSLPNQLVALAIQEQAIPELQGYGSIRREVKYGEGSRIDVLLEDGTDDPRPCYVEVKSVTLGGGEIARFPDAVTKRGQKHLKELT
ncbi:MAG: DNA/RNA nuclease SfsA, partial [Myxococcota bacterium]|nr:DNA/RNA nuclease SfsA [Myxococcota bacterium]